MTPELITCTPLAHLRWGNEGPLVPMLHRIGGGRQAWESMMASVPEATYRAGVAALVAFDRRADLPRIAVPTRVLTGEHDRTAPPEVARRMAERIPGALCRIRPGAGHLLNLEHPQAFDTALLQFLRQR